MIDTHLPTPSGRDGRGQASRRRPPMPLHSIAIALHVISAVIWVGGMFLIYVCLRPALGVLEAPQRLQLMRAVLARFFPVVWGAILTILATGYWMLFVTFHGFSGVGMQIHWMQLFG